MGWYWWDVKVESRTIDLFPSTHPYVETFEKYSDVFGGASRVVLEVQVKKGTIFEQEDARRRSSASPRTIELLPGINNYQVLSIAQRKAKELKIDSVAGFRSVPVMWPDVPRPDAEIEDLAAHPGQSSLYGSLVSLDKTATLVVAGFFEDNLNPKLIYERIDRIVEKESDDNTKIHVIGRPMLVGDIMTESPQLFLIMASRWSP